MPLYRMLPDASLETSHCAAIEADVGLCRPGPGSNSHLGNLARVAPARGLTSREKGLILQCSSRMCAPVPCAVVHMLAFRLIVPGWCTKWGPQKGDRQAPAWGCSAVHGLADVWLSIWCC